MNSPRSAGIVRSSPRMWPSADTAVIAYQVHQTGTLKDQRMDLRCADSTTWVREGKSWKCVLHTETVMGQPTPN